MKTFHGLRIVVVSVLAAAGLVSCGGNPGGGGGGTPPDPPTVQITSAPATMNAAAETTLTASITPSTATVTWSASPDAGSFSPASGTSVVYTAPADTALTSSPEQVTITATATNGSQTATSTVTVTVDRTITIGFAPNATIPNSELYSDFGALIGLAFQCTGCKAGDTLYAVSSGGESQGTFGAQFPNPFEVYFIYMGDGDIPSPVSLWIEGSDGVKSNTLWFTYDGSEDMATEDPSSGEIFYAYTAGSGTNFSFYVQKYKQDGTPDGNFSGSAVGIAVDNATHDVVYTGKGIGILDFDGNPLGGISSNSYYLAVSAADGLGCATQPENDLVTCFDPPAQSTANTPNFNLPGIPSGSQPTPVVVIDGSHVVVYGRGDQTLRWYTINGTSATAAGTLPLSEFTAVNAAYWKQYPFTGGWEMVYVDGTLCVMGQVVSADGTTVSQKLALVDNTNQTLTQYVTLPPGTIHIAADPVHNGVVAEYVDFSGTTPITRFARVDVNTGTVTTLQSTSQLFPGAGFLVTNDGSQIAVFVQGKADFIPNQ